MKKKLRLAAAVLALLGVCVSLCGCQELDDMKAKQAFWTENGSILWNEAVYKPIDTEEPFSFREYTQSVYVTQPDVPVLLSDMFGAYGAVYCDELLIQVRQHNEDRNGGAYTYKTYCREEFYDAVVKSLTDLREGKQSMDTYAYTYTVWDEDTMTYEDIFYILGENHTAALKTTLIEGEFASWVETCEVLCVIEAYTQDLLFSDGAWEVATLYDVYDSNVADADKRYAVYDGQNAVWYVVPDDLTSAYEDMLAPVLAAYREEMPWDEDVVW